MKIKKIYYLLFGFVLFIPLGLMTSNPAWGEWSEEHYKQVLGFVPKNIEQTKGFNAPFSDYTTSFLGDIGSYYFSAFIGILILFGVFILLQKVAKIEKSKR